MHTINKRLILQTLAKHETLTIDDLSKEENLGLIPNQARLQMLLDEMKKTGLVETLDGATPVTYTITGEGIAEHEKQTEADVSTSTDLKP